MKIIGLRSRCATSPTDKFYTVIITDRGDIISGYGPGSKANDPSAGAHVKQAGVANSVASYNTLMDVVAVFAKGVRDRREGRDGYHHVDIPITSIHVPNRIANMSRVSADFPKEILAHFYNSRQAIEAQDVQNWRDEAKALQGFVKNATNVRADEIETEFANRRISTASMRVSNSTVITRKRAIIDGFKPDEKHQPAGVAKTSRSTAQSTAQSTAKAQGLRISGALIRPNGEAYTPRYVGPHHDVALMRHLHNAGIAVRLPGPPGAGKTALIEAAFPDALTISGHGDMTIDDFVGSFLPDTQNPGEWKWVDGPLSSAMKQGVVLYVDEITRIPQEVLAVLYSVMDGRGVLRIDRRPDMPPIKAAEGFGVVSAYNPDALGTRPMDEALMSRFKVAIEVTTDYDTAQALKVPDKFITVARNMHQRNQKDRAAGGIGIWVPQMRELLAARDLLNAGVGEAIAVGAFLASCPDEDSKAELAEAITSTFGITATPLSLGRSI